MAGVYVLNDDRPILQDRHASDFWINGTWDSVVVIYVGF